MAGRSPLPPYPNGWFAIGFADELPPGGLLARSFMGREVVVFRARDGQACAADAYCPHLGAHFGHGGRVEGDYLRCPFHGFRFDTKGVCVRTGYGTPPPPPARLRLWPLREVNGILLVYHDLQDRPPGWEVPALDMVGWTPPVSRTFTLRDHPQETTENSVDVGHFAIVHGYRDVRTLRDVRIAGPMLSTAYAARRPLPALDRLAPRWHLERWNLEIRFETEIYGLGYSLVHVDVPLARLRARLWVLPTAIDEERIVLRLATSARVPGREGGGPSGVARQILARAARWATMSGLARDARQDFDIWQHKRYAQPPALARGDGPIGKYRTWARQFYTTTENTERGEGGW